MDIIYNLFFVTLGSHKGTWYLPRTFETKAAKWFKEGELPEINTDQIQSNHVIGNLLLKNVFLFFLLIEKCTGWSVDPGDVVAFHMATLHAAPGSVGNARRRVFSLR